MSIATIELSSPQIKTLQSRKQLTLNMAGQRSGKTFLIGFKTALYIINAPKITGMIAANTYMQLTQTTIREVKKVWKSIYGLTQYDKKGNPDGDYVINLQPPAHFVKHEKFDNYHSIISFRNGGIIFIASLDNYMAHDGKNIGWAELDETKDTKEDALKAVILARLSQPGFVYHKDTLEVDYIEDVKDPENYINWNPCTINTSPAIGVVKWVTDLFGLETYEQEILTKITDPKDFFHLETENQSVTISSTYHNAHNLSKGYIDNRLSQLSEGEGLKFVYGFPFARTGNSFFRKFSKVEHVKDVSFNPELPINLSYDFNSKPYMTLLAAQTEFVEDVKEFQIRFFKEYCLPSPLNSTEAVTRAFIDDYGHFDPFVNFYGDASGDYRQAGSGDHTQFDTVREELAPFISRSSDRVARKNKNVLNRRDFVDRILERKLQIPYGSTDYTVTIIIDESCVNLISDMQWLKEGLDGKLKEKEKDPETGVVYEKLGHCFVGETMVITSKGEKRIDEIEKGDFVLTRGGFRKVKNTFFNGIRDVSTRKIADRLLTCTDDHLIFTHNRGFVKASNVLRSDIFCIFEGKSIREWNQNSKLSTTSVLEDIRIPHENQIEDISEDGLRFKVKEKRYTPIDMFGLCVMGIFQRAITFTIRMKIHLITISKILNAFRLKITRKSTLPTKENLRLHDFSLIRQFQLQRLGMLLKKDCNGIETTQKRHFLPNQLDICALNVEPNLSVNILHTHDIADTRVKSDMVITGKPQKRKVYDIEVEGNNEYFANGILVHNCSDALEYLIVEMLDDYYQK